MKKLLVMSCILIAVAAAIIIINKPSAEKLVGGIFELPKKPPVETKSYTVIFGGDLMYDRYIRQIAQTKGYDYSLTDLTEVLNSADIVVANLEGPITNNESISIGSEIGSRENYIFTIDPEVMHTLNKFMIRTVNIGNNHILNFGYNGLEQTLDYLGQAEIRFFGDIQGAGDVSHTTYIGNNAIPIGLVSYNQFGGNGREATIQSIEELNDAEFTVVFAHWGTEYTTTAGNEIQELAHEFIDSGADLVIGGHPHVIQQIEEYRGKKIYYSLGNFVADQYFERDVTKGMLVELTLNKTEGEPVQTDFQEIYIRMDPSGKTTLDN